MNNEQKDNLLTVGGSLKSWSSAIELISITGGLLGFFGFIWVTMATDVSVSVSGFVLFGGLLSIIASSATGFLIAKCLEAGSLALQSLSIIHTEILILANKAEK